MKGNLNLIICLAVLISLGSAYNLFDAKDSLTSFAHRLFGTPGTTVSPPTFYLNCTAAIRRIKFIQKMPIDYQTISTGGKLWTDPLFFYNNALYWPWMGVG